MFLWIAFHHHFGFCMERNRLQVYFVFNKVYLTVRSYNFQQCLYLITSIQNSWKLNWNSQSRSICLWTYSLTTTIAHMDYPKSLWLLSVSFLESSGWLHRLGFYFTYTILTLLYSLQLPMWLGPDYIYYLFPWYLPYMFIEFYPTSLKFFSLFLHKTVLSPPYL